jgi:hypothetical protein
VPGIENPSVSTMRPATGSAACVSPRAASGVSNSDEVPDAYRDGT